MPLQKSAPPEPSFTADVAAQVVAWHNRHPLARRISRKDVQGIGIIALPFARPAQPAWNAVSPKRGLLALMFPKKVDRRPWPAFSEDALPDIPIPKLAPFALKHGWIERPGPTDLPDRVLQVDPDLMDTPAGRPAALESPERLDRFLLTAAIDLGPTRPRLVLGRGRRMPVRGQRLMSLPRIAVLAGGLIAVMMLSVVGLWIAATKRPSPDAARVPAASAPAASVAASAAPRAAVPAPVPPASTAAPVAPPAAPHEQTASAPVATAPAVAPSVPAPAAAASPAPSPAAAPASAPSSAAAPAAPAAPAAASAPIRPPPMPLTQRASATLVPRLRPDLAASARADADRAGLPQRPPAASAPPGGVPAAPGTLPGLPPSGTPSADAPPAPRTQPPGEGAASTRTPARFYALVSRPMRSEAEGKALLSRLRAETQRINHPTATETSLQRTPEGWRITWWPFTHPRQAENARAALAARKVDLEMVEF